MGIGDPPGGDDPGAGRPGDRSSPSGGEVGHKGPGLSNPGLLVGIVLVFLAVGSGFLAMVFFIVYSQPVDHEYDPLATPVHHAVMILGLFSAAASIVLAVSALHRFWSMTTSPESELPGT